MKQRVTTPAGLPCTVGRVWMPEKKTLWRRKKKGRRDRDEGDLFLDVGSTTPTGGGGGSRGDDPFASAAPAPGGGGRGSGIVDASTGNLGGPGGGSGAGGSGGGSGGSGGGWFDLGGDDFGVGVVILLAVGVFILLAFLMTTVVFPVLVIGLEVLIVLVVFLGGLGGRLLFRKPWTVRAKAADGRRLEWHVRGFRASGRVRDEVVAALAAGQEPRPAGAERVTPPAAPARA